MKNYKGRIVDISKSVDSTVWVTQGIKKENQSFYDSNYAGSNGSYVTGGEYGGTSINMKVYVYDLEKSITFDIWRTVLQQNNKKRISSKLLDYVIKKNEGQKINISFDEDIKKWILPLNELDLIKS